MSNKWDKIISDVVGKNVTITITKSITGDAWSWMGKIVEHVTDEINGGYVVFEHLPIERTRTQSKQTLIHLGLYHIGMIDVLEDSYSPNLYASCPSCSERLKLEELAVDINKEEERGEEESRIILLPMNLEEAEEKMEELIQE